MKLKLRSTSAEQTQEIGRRLARVLKAGDVLLLSAPLGSGKTTFVQGLARGLGVKEAVMSPTFVLAQTWPGRVPLHHLDFYRLTAKEVNDIGIADYLSGGGEIPKGVVAIEWPEKSHDIWPADHLKLSISIKKRTWERELVFTATGPLARRALQALKKARV